MIKKQLIGGLFSLYPNKLKNWFSALSAWQQILSLRLRLVLEQCRSLQTLKFAPPPRRIPNFSICLGIFALQSLLQADEVGGECCQPEIITGEPMVCGQLPSIYPQSASIDLGNCIDVYITGDFTYWAAYFWSAAVGFRNTADGRTGMLYMKDHYRPGFKVGVGIDASWVVLDAQYIWWHHTYHTNYSANVGESLTPFVFSEFLGWLLPPNYSQLRSKWKYDFDQFYFTMQRPFYSGTRLILDAVVGVMAQWFKQDILIDCINEVDGAAPGVNGFINSKHSNWALGPSAGLRAKAFLYGGVTALGNFDLALCYQRWTKASDTLSFPPVNPFNPLANSTQEYKASRSKAVFTAALGLGWESYLACQQYHLNISVLYDMIATLGNTVNLENVLMTDSYLHGWTLEARFDF